MSASITLYSHSSVLIPVMRWYLLSTALSVQVAISLPDDFQSDETEPSYNTPDLQVSTIDTGLLKIYHPGSSDVPVTFLDAIPTDLEVVPAELASDGGSCLPRRDTAETEGRIDKRAMCANREGARNSVPTLRWPSIPQTSAHANSTWSGRHRSYNQASAKAATETTWSSSFTSTNQQGLW